MAFGVVNLPVFFVTDFFGRIFIRLFVFRQDFTKRMFCLDGDLSQWLLDAFIVDNVDNLVYKSLFL